MTQTLILVDAVKPGALDLGEVVLFSLGGNAYAVSLPAYYEMWHVEQIRGILETTLDSPRLFFCQRSEGQRASFTPLQDSADLKTLLAPIVKEILEENHA